MTRKPLDRDMSATALAGRGASCADMRPWCLALLAAACLLAPGRVLLAQSSDSLPGPLIFAIGADLSFLKSAEDRGIRFRDGGAEKPGLDIFRDHGYDWIRLRLFHTPTELPNNLAYTIALAQDAKARGYRFLLDYHYSDTWADPQHQITPRAWDTVDVRVLADSVFRYTRDTFRAFRDAGVTPDMVQIGNEVRVGMMWPLGKLPEHWDNFALLYGAALAGIDSARLYGAALGGIDSARGQAPRPLIMLHYDNGADTEGARSFYQRFNGYGHHYDVIGYSYYPWWHGNLLELRDNLLSTLAQFPDKDVMLVEVGYRPQVYEREGRPAPHPADSTGDPRRAFLEAVTQTVLAIPDRRLKGIFWWEPAIRCPSDFFDESCDSRPVIRVFDRYRRR